MSATSAAESAAVILQVPWLKPTPDDLPFESSDKITLSLFWQRCCKPEDTGNLAAATLNSTRGALVQWGKCFPSEPDVRQVDRKTWDRFRHWLRRTDERVEDTNEKIERTLRAVFARAVEWEVIEHVPKQRRRRGAKAIRKRPRKLLTDAEFARLIGACRHATYPEGAQFPAPRLWSVALFLLWFYGARVFDVFDHLKFSDIERAENLITYRAQKTRKIHAVPLTPLASRLLKSIEGYSDRMFAGFNTRGHRAAGGHWKRGHYTTWRNEILPAAELAAPLVLNDFRKFAVTRWDGFGQQFGEKLGAWIAGHSLPSVTEVHYINPEQWIRDAFEAYQVAPEIVAALDVYQERPTRLSGTGGKAAAGTDGTRTRTSRKQGEESRQARLF